MHVDGERSADQGGSVAGELDTGPSSAVSDPATARQHLRDTAALLALPRAWRDKDPLFIAGNLVEVLISMLRADAVHVRLSSGSEIIVEQSRLLRPTGRVARTTVVAPGEREPQDPPVAGVAPRSLRVPGRVADLEADVLIVSGRPDFPTEFETFLAHVAVEQALIAVRASRLVTSLSAANAAKATFLATMSHELRTPLNAIIGYSELLTAEISGPLSGHQGEHIHRIHAAARHLIELIESILGFARLEAGREKTHPAFADARRLTDEVIAIAEPLAGAKRLSLEVICGPDLPMMYTDPGKVRQILLNLLSNAVKFTEEGRVTLEVTATAEEVCWLIRDTGIGIAASDMDRIFEPFRQVGESHANRAPGTGLGLSVSRQLARLLGGDITAQSEIGRGSRFLARLPISLA